MSTIIILIILSAFIVIGIRETIKHTKGQGGCCGGAASPTQKVETASLNGPVVQQTEIRIEGMHCENCASTVARSLQRIPGVSAEVDHRKGIARIRADREIPLSQLEFQVTRAGYTCLSSCNIN